MRKGLSDILVNRRFFFALYLSLIFHSSLWIYTSQSSGIVYERTLCGPSWIYEEEDETQNVLSLQFGKGDGDGTGQNFEEGEVPSQDADNGAKVGLDKYKGTAWESLAKELESTSTLRQDFKNEVRDLIPNSGVADSYINRSRDFEDIIIKEVFPTVSTINDPFRVDLNDAEDNLFLHKERNKIIQEFRTGEEPESLLSLQISKPGETIQKSPLRMEKITRQDYLDKTLKQKKEYQLDQFINRYMGYDPNEGDLNSFVRELYYENLQRLAYPFSANPTYFTIDYYQENLNKEDFLRQMMALLANHLGDKTGTEILFTIENIYEIQARALLYYFQARDYLQANPKEITIQSETLRRVEKKYKQLFKDKKLFKAEDVEKAYTKKRLEILDTLIKNTPKAYRTKDAIFEKGRVLWESGYARKDSQLMDQALRLWSTISTYPKEGDFLNEKALESIQLTLRDLGNPNTVVGMPEGYLFQIDSILKFRWNETLQKKKDREDKLLWKKNQTVR